MGCWNGTCGLTHLPILAGDPIRVVLITGQMYRRPRENDEFPAVDQSGFCYANDCWTPRTITIKGRYNDYGGIEDVEIDPLHEQIIRQGLMEDLVEVSGDRMDKIGDGPVTVEWLKKINIETLLNDGIERDRIWVYGTRRDEYLFDKEADGQHRRVDIPKDKWEYAPLGLWMCHEGAYQAALEGLKVLTYGPPVGYVTRASLRERGRKFAAKLLEVSKDLQGHLHALYTSLSMPGERDWLLSDPPFIRGIQFYVSEILGLFSKGTSLEKILPLVEEISDFSTLQIAMSRGRIAWMPQTGKGSQDDETGIHVALAKFTRQWVTAQNKKTASHRAESRRWVKKRIAEQQGSSKSSSE